MNRERLIELAKEAGGIVSVEFPHYNSEGHTVVSLEETELESFARLMLKEVAGEPMAWITEPTKGVAHKALGKSVDLFEPVHKHDWKVTPLYAIKEIERGEPVIGGNDRTTSGAIGQP